MSSQDEEGGLLLLLLAVSDKGTVQVELKAVGPTTDQHEPKIQAAQEEHQLKHLTFVAVHSRTIVHLAERLYSTLTTNALRIESPSFKTLEHHVTRDILTPLAAASQGALHSLDARLDALLLKLAPFSPLHKDSPQAWSQLPGVASLCRTLEPAARLGLTALHTLHDHLVPSSYYKAAVDLTTGSLSYASSLPPYKLASHYIYPMVQPVADAAFSSEAVQECCHAVLEYWKPTSKGNATTKHPLPTSNGSSSPPAKAPSS